MRKQVPKRLWQHLGEQLGMDPPDLGTLRSLYDGRSDMLADHQKLAYEALGFRPMAEHQRRYVVRWLKERLSGRQDRTHVFGRHQSARHVRLPGRGFCPSPDAERCDPRAGARLAAGTRMRWTGGTTSSWAIMRGCEFFKESS